MCKLSQRVVIGLLIVMIGGTVPGPALSQEPDKPAADPSEKIDQMKDVGELSLDDLKDKRSRVENAVDLSETVKKNVLHNLDKTIRFREQETQLAGAAIEISQMVKAAPERIKEIEAELDRSLPEASKAQQVALQGRFQALIVQRRAEDHDPGDHHQIGGVLHPQPGGVYRREWFFGHCSVSLFWGEVLLMQDARIECLSPPK